MVDEASEELQQLEEERSVIRKLLEDYKEKITFANQIGDSSAAYDLQQEMKPH